MVLFDYIDKPVKRFKTGFTVNRNSKHLSETGQCFEDAAR